ncbi:MAG: glycosyltransferase [Candidatus Latescibacteria bacterium]|jgi:glycosyltransferase involved in cell wall biosynthesis|nr:glycosyltransferase [Candidatus Latescibacterota bacterium]
MSDIKGKSFVIVKHTYFESLGTPEAELVRFLGGQASSIQYIRHPFPDADKIPLNTTIVEYGSDGELAREIKAPLFRGHSVLFYIKDFIFSIYYVFKSGCKDIYIGADNLNALAGIALRFLGRVRYVVFYVIDFTPARFKNKLLNTIYQFINKICCYHADMIWNVSDSMIEGRESIGISRDLSAPQVTVPLGCAFDEILRKDISDINRYDIVYFGSLRKEHGPGLIIEALPAIIEKEPRFRVVFAGDGELREKLVKRSEELGVSSHVQFAGFIDSGEEVYKLLTSCGLALATYPSEGSTYKLYSDPGKVKIYLACGLPILITDVPPIAKTLQERGAGKIVEHNPMSLARAVNAIGMDYNGYKLMREQAIVLAAEFDWEVIWRRTFASMDL